MRGKRLCTLRNYSHKYKNFLEYKEIIKTTWMKRRAKQKMNRIHKHCQTSWSKQKQYYDRLQFPRGEQVVVASQLTLYISTYIWLSVVLCFFFSCFSFLLLHIDLLNIFLFCFAFLFFSVFHHVYSLVLFALHYSPVGTLL